MYLFDPNSVLLEANDRYYEMTGHPRDCPETSFLEYIAEGSKKACKDMWAHLTTKLAPISVELELYNPHLQPRDLTSGEPIEYWVLASSMTELDREGKLQSVMGSMADISHLKWAQGLQERRIREAEETKRQQNEFIDITSHEMRNVGCHHVFHVRGY